MRATGVCNGFTVVELVVVLLLLGILSAVAMPRFLGANTFAAAVLAQHTREDLAYARQLASSRQDTETRFRFSATVTSWDLETTTLADGVLREWSVDDGGLSVQVANGAATVSMTPGDVLELVFNGRGHVVAATASAAVLDPSLGIALLIDGASLNQICIHPSGATTSTPCV